jgi:two-component system response regulator
MIEHAIEILLVEDNPNDVELALYAFHKSNLTGRIQVMRDGAEALEFIFHSGAYSERLPKENPRLILLDLKLPKVDGVEVLRQVKANPQTRRIPVVVMTSTREDQDIQTCYELCANSYIVKPVDFEKFIEAVTILGQYWLVYNQPPVNP